MLRLVSKRLVPAVLSLALVLPLAGHADPVLRVTIAPPHELDTFVGEFAKLGEKPEKASVVRDLFVKSGTYDGAGLDTSKRIGLIVNYKEGAPPMPTIVAAVKDETKFLAAFKPFYPQQEKLPDGRWKLVTDKSPPLAIRIDKGFAFVNMLSEAEIPPPLEPEKIIAGRGTLDVFVSVSSIPDSAKKQVVEGVKQGGEQKAAQLRTEQEKSQVRAGTQAFVAALEKFFSQTDSLDFVLALSPQEFRVDFEMKTKAGISPVAAAPTAPIGLSRLVPATAAVGFTSDMSLDELARTSMRDSAKTGFDAARKQGGPAPTMKFLDAMEVEVQNLVTSGRVEGIAMVEGKKGNANVVMMIRTASQSKMGDAIKSMVDEVLKNPQATPRPTVKTEGNLTIYSMESPNKSMSADLGGSEITLGVRPGLMTMVLGARTTEKIKSLLARLDGNKTPVPPGIGSTKGWFGVRTFADIGGVNLFAKSKEDEDVFLKVVTSGADQIGFQLEPQKDGYKSGLFVQGGLVALIARAFVKDSPPGAPPPGLQAPPASPGATAPAPEASPTPGTTPPRGTSPEASPSPAGEGEGERDDKDEKGEGGEKKDE